MAYRQTLVGYTPLLCLVLLWGMHFQNDANGGMMSLSEKRWFLVVQTPRASLAKITRFGFHLRRFRQAPFYAHNRDIPAWLIL